MEKLFEKFIRKIDQAPLGFTRYLMNEVDWSNRLIGIKGARGTGKTTLLLQYAREHLPLSHQTLYVSLDDLYFRENHLVNLADVFVRQGGKYLLLDEVHRYQNWSAEIKNIFDDHPGLQVIFTGSSIIHLSKAKADLSRRAIMYELNGLSYREFINLKKRISLPVIDWDSLTEKHTEFAREVMKKIRPLEQFGQYLSTGYYPYFLENNAVYAQKLAETIDLAMNTDLPAFFDISYSSIEKLKQLLFILSESVPFQPNVSKLSERIGVTRNTLIMFFSYLEELRIIKRIYSSSSGIGSLQKPDKILMHHPNLQFALAYEDADKGSIRESFFVNQVGCGRKIMYSKIGDFMVGNRLFEIGGRNKNDRQIQGAANAYIVADDLEIGVNNRLPLWIFGFLY